MISAKVGTGVKLLEKVFIRSGSFRFKIQIKRQELLLKPFR
jgi:hypothetical protein